MDPNRGCFVSVDPFAGDPMAPISLHRYLYANASPVSFYDPSGNWSDLVELQIAMNVCGILAAGSQFLVGTLVNLGWGGGKAVYWNGEGYSGQVSILGVGGWSITGGMFFFVVESEEVKGEQKTIVVEALATGFSFLSYPLPAAGTIFDVQMLSPALFGLKYPAFVGFFQWHSLGGALGVGGSSTLSTLGFGAINFLPGSIQGLDFGFDTLVGTCGQVTFAEY